MIQSRFSAAAFGGGEAGELAAADALDAHDAQIIEGVSVRVYRAGHPGPEVGSIGVVERRDGGRRAVVRVDDLSWILEVGNLEVV